MGNKYIKSLCLNKFSQYQEEKEDYSILKSQDTHNSKYKSVLHTSFNIMNDYQYLINETWIANLNPLNFFPEKLSSLYIDYQFDQELMEKKWMLIDFNSFSRSEFFRENLKSICPNLKYLLRKGCPFKFLRQIFLKMFHRFKEDNLTHYEIVSNLIFKEPGRESFLNVPTFTENDDYDEMCKFHILNSKGHAALKRLLWILKKTEIIEYSPLLIHVLSFLILFLHESEAYFIIKILIKESKLIYSKKPESLKWQFTINEIDHLKLSKSFIEKFKNNSLTVMRIVSHLEEIKFDYLNFFKQLSQNFFLEFLKFSDVTRIFCAFINEGIKVHYRIVYAICKMFLKIILKHEDPNTLTVELAKNTSKMTHLQSKELFKIAYNLKFKENNYYLQTKVRLSKIHELKIYYLPTIIEKSNIISDDYFEIIWEWLPSFYRILDPYLIFSTKKNGYFLKTLYGICAHELDNQMLLLIKTDKNIVFGFFSPNMLTLNENKKYYGSNDTFVFIISPKQIKFDSTNENNNYIYCCFDYFCIGDSENGAALTLDSDLNYGHSYKSSTFANIPLHLDNERSNFKCINLEVYCLK